MANNFLKLKPNTAKCVFYMLYDQKGRFYKRSYTNKNGKRIIETCGYNGLGVWTESNLAAMQKAVANLPGFNVVQVTETTSVALSFKKIKKP